MQSLPKCARTPPCRLWARRYGCVAIDYRIVPGSFPNHVVSVGVCYTAVDAAAGACCVSWSVLHRRGCCRRRLDHGMVGCCVEVLLVTSVGRP